MAATPTTRGAIQSLIDRRDRNFQTALVARVKSYDRDLQTAVLEPQLLEYYEPTQDTQQLPDLDNVPVMFPGASDYSITWDLSPGDFVMVLCTKYSLDIWRQRAELSDPGDSRKFGLSGATCYPVRVNPDGAETDEVKADGMVIAAPKIYLTSKDAADAMALASLVKARLDKIQTTFDAHTHPVAYNAGPTASTTTATVTGTKIDPLADTGSTKVIAD